MWCGFMKQYTFKGFADLLVTSTQFNNQKTRVKKLSSFGTTRVEKSAKSEKNRNICQFFSKFGLFFEMFKN